MRPILIFAIAAVAASAIGVGALNNEIQLIVQQFGVGSADIESPIDAARIDFELEAVPVIDPQTNGTLAYKNLITGCSFHSDESIGGGEVGENETDLNDARIICKLSDAEHAIVAEGVLSFNEYVGSSRVIIPIDQLAYPGANDFLNVKDVHIVVMGNDPTQPPLPEILPLAP